ncbi:MAG: hypothetical protein PHX70_10005 [Clostridium sp.]|nr:hypothetical protein [Clostridium sp.]
MANEVSTGSVAIQRNVLDVSLELTQMYYKDNSIKNIEDLQETFTVFHTLVCTLQFKGYDQFKDLLGKNIKEMLKK